MKNTGNYGDNFNLNHANNEFSHLGVPRNPTELPQNNYEIAKTLNELIRGERSAVETYQQAFEKVKDDPRTADLQAVVSDHQQAIRLLSAKVQACGEKASTDSGTWGTWAQVIMGTAKLFGDRSAVTALMQGEEHGLQQYRDALKGETLDASSKSIIQNQLLPQQKAHIDTLERIIDLMN